MTIIDGKKIAENIIAELGKMPKPDKMLAAVLVGSANSPQVAQSQSFLRQKEKMAEQLGIPFHLYQYDESTTENELIKEIQKLGEDEEIGGLIVQLPLPKQFNRDRVLAAINPRQDIDALTPESGQLVNPLPVEVVKDIFKIMKYGVENKTVAVVGRGFLVGKPIAEWLNRKCKKLIVLNSKSDLRDLKEADLVITGVGKAGLIKPKILKTNAAVIDFGYDIKNGKIIGDLDTTDFSLSASRFPLSWYTPTPGGTGPMLVAEIFKNFYKLNQSL